MLSAETHQGTRLMTANPSRSGMAHIALLLTEDEAQPELALELRGGREKGKEQREITLQQVLFEHRASVPIAGRLRAMRFEGGAHDRRLVIMAEDREVIWDVSTPVAPMLMQSTVNGRQGIFSKEGHAENTYSETSRLGHTHHDLVVHSGKRMGITPGSKLVRALERLGEQHRALEVVASPRVGGVKETLYVRTKAGATLFDISNPEEPHEMHVYDRPAWFEDVAFGGKLLAKYNARLGSIDLYTAALSNECE